MKLHTATTLTAVLGLAMLSTAPGSRAQAGPTVAVLADRFLWAGQAFGDVDALAAAVAVVRPASVALVACGSGTTRSLMNAAYRLRERPLHLRAAEPAEPACDPAAMRPAALRSSGSRHDDLDEVERYWRGMHP